MALFDFLKKKKEKDEVVENTIINETTLDSQTEVQNQEKDLESQFQSVLEGTKIDFTPTNLESNENTFTPTEIIQNDNSENEIVDNGLVLEEAPTNDEIINPIIEEPVSAETTEPVSDNIEEINDTSINNPTPEVEITQKEINDDVKFCPNCGNMETGDEIICSNCGSRL